MYERRGQPLLSRPAFLRRLGQHAAAALGLVAGALGIGVLGYHGLVGLSWVDSFLNAAMILGGMGPVNPITTQGGKVFAALYALFSGLLFLVVAGVLFAPVVHRFLHYFHLESGQDEDSPQ
jgi:TRAP-type C4-dicarboxylate transport system permease small subunit